MLKSDAAAFLAGVKQVEGAAASAPTNLHVITGEVGATSEDGKTTISLDGLVFSEEDSQEIEMDTLGGLEEGDVATVLLTGENGRGMTPLAIGAPGSIDRIKTIASNAAEIANAAQEVAEATNQHFFDDDNGIHVTEATQEEWDASHTGANVLINSIGQLFRDGLNNLLTLTTENGARALTIWDGLGNTASNILARFSSDGISFSDGTSFDIGDSSSYIHFDGNGHINIGGSGLTIGGYIPTGGVTVNDLTQAAQDATLNSNMDGDIYQSAQPNLSPFFEIAPNDATYWYATGNLKTKTTPLGDGWSHVEYSSLNLNVSPRVGVLNLAPSTKYTVMLEVRNATALTNCRFYLYTDTNSMWTASVNTTVSANGTYYLTGQTKADLTDSAITHLRIFVGHNSSAVNADIRLSLYEGEYDGPYKPYSGTRLFATQTDASNAAKTATSYVTDITGGGIMVHPSTDQTTGVRVTSDVDILRSGTSVANYGTTARIGTSAGKHVSIDSDSVDLMDGNASLATFGANDTHIGMSGTGNVYMANDKFLLSAETSEGEYEEGMTYTQVESGFKAQNLGENYHVYSGLNSKLNYNDDGGYTASDTYIDAWVEDGYGSELCRSYIELWADPLYQTAIRLYGDSVELNGKETWYVSPYNEYPLQLGKPVVRDASTTLTIGTVNVWVDGPTVYLDKGYWCVVTCACFNTGSSSGTRKLRTQIRRNTTVWAEGSEIIAASNAFGRVQAVAIMRIDADETPVTAVVSSSMTFTTASSVYITAVQLA